VSLARPVFVSCDPQAITSEMVADYEGRVGRTLYPAQVERLLIDFFAYRETLVRLAIQQAAEQNLVAFARAPMLDYLGELVGVTRIPAQPAATVLRFSTEAGPVSPLLIPAGTRVESRDGAIAFATDTDAIVAAGATSIDIPATCTTAGVAGNGWAAGQIATLIDDVGAGTLTVANTSVTADGDEAEKDDRLRDSIRLAPESFSTAGSRAAYRFHAMRASTQISDVAVLTPKAGDVAIYPLTTSGLPSETLLALVAAMCSAEKVRPLTDTVFVLSPIERPFTVRANVKIYADRDPATVLAACQASIAAWATDRAAGLGRDVVPSQANAALSVAGIYEVELIEPSAPIVVAENEWAHCTSITVALAGLSNG